MAELYSIGVNRIVYRSVSFATGQTVTAYFWNPSLTKSALQTFTELELGLYYLDYNFTTCGTYLALVFENGVSKQSGVFRVSSLASLGSGATSKTYTLTDDDAQPIPDADIWVTTDEAGSNVIASGKTDQNGQVTFYLDSGTVYIWRQKSGWNFDNPDTEAV